MATATLGKVGEFNQLEDSWQNYIERLGFFFTANGIDDADKKKAVLLSCCGATTYQLIRGLVMPAKPIDKSFDELVTVMKEHLNPKPNIIAERFRFNSRVQKSNETISQF